MHRALTRGGPARRPARLRLTAVAAAVAFAGGTALVQSAPARAATGALPANTTFYINPNSAVEKWLAANPGDSRAATISAKIAGQAQGTWFTTYNPATIASQVSALASAAAAKGQVPLLIMYDIPNRDCGGASAGGANTIANYEGWASAFASGLGSATAIVLVEPDSLALQTCLSAADVTARDAAISYDGQVLHADDPNAHVYFDGGHSDWNPASQQAAALKAANVTTEANGVFTDVSNFEWNNDELWYGQQILQTLGDSSLHLVVDTSRNGAGPGNTWCDPSGRALGLTPTANTGYSYVDAFVWAKPPGESDGCADAAGTFDPALANALATNPPVGLPSCKITYTVQSSWTGGLTVNVTVANTGTAPLGGWTVNWTFPGDEKITNLWEGYYSQTGETVAAHDYFGTNQTIAAGSTASFGFQGTWSASNASPTSFTMIANNGGTAVTCATS
ncbi:MAG TPA: glycoside hydrolase family 6 protein [Actinocrinis sp.]|uniref:glycoside hydrolase family 6 protein n=1 Tax=Actinocrinis sp. TaxID=1920516 RepID=UPI002DDCCC73|nr:glycoside hydrolase family 6 protein [Actinocrinis sp.]HEV2345292.1 glycoside hydrolase family 6 protein [Actinocrinis sp.]